jgi:hypothetical protein
MTKAKEIDEEMDKDCVCFKELGISSMRGVSGIRDWRNRRDTIELNCTYVTVYKIGSKGINILGHRYHFRVV